MRVPPVTTPRNPIRFRLTWVGVAGLLVVLALLVAGIVGLAGWVNVPQGHFVVLVKKTGKNLANAQLLASAPDFKGVELDVVKEGYHYFNPMNYTWTAPIEATVLPEMQVGILTRKYGNALPVGQVLAETDDQKGVLEEPISPGRYYLNTYAYGVQLQPMVRIDPGFMGVVTLLVGDAPADPNVFVVKEGERGTQPFLLPPGVHPKYSNRWRYTVVPIDVRSQKIELSGSDEVTFPSQDGFTIHTEGTIEYALDLKKVPELFVTYVDTSDMPQSGGLKNIEEKLVLPEGRSLCRIYGAQHRAVDYLIGSTRLAVQSQIERELRDTCAKEGIIIRSFVIRSANPPPEILSQYQRREVARQEQEQFKAQITTEVGYPATEGGKPKLDANGNPVFDHGVPIVDGGKPRLDASGQPVYAGGRLAKEIQTRMKDRVEQLGGVNVEVVGVKREAEQYGLVQLTKANQRLEVAKLKLEAANDLAASKLAAGEAQASVIRLKNAAQAAGVQASVEAFGSGPKYAQYLMTQKFAPSIRSVWSNTDGFFTSLFPTATGATTRPAGQP